MSIEITVAPILSTWPPTQVGAKPATVHATGGDGEPTLCGIPYSEDWGLGNLYDLASVTCVSCRSRFTPTDGKELTDHDRADSALRAVRAARNLLEQAQYTLNGATVSGLLSPVTMIDDALNHINEAAGDLESELYQMENEEED